VRTESKSKINQEPDKDISRCKSKRKSKRKSKSKSKGKRKGKRKRKRKGSTPLPAAASCKQR
jgi:hypothetical protein